MRIASFRRALLRATPLLLVACASHAPSPPPPPGTGLTLLKCRTAHPAAAEASVGSDGDEIRVRGHTFHLPPGAVRQVTGFRVADRTDGYAGVEITPHGTQFDAPARLTLSYARCGTEVAGYRRLQIVQVEVDSLQRTVIVDSTLQSQWNPRDSTVTAHIRHLSGYLISGT
jgi:hypothetical protein